MSIVNINIVFLFQLQEYKVKAQETQSDLQRQLQTSKKVCAATSCCLPGFTEGIIQYKIYV